MADEKCDWSGEEKICWVGGGSDGSSDAGYGGRSGSSCSLQ